MRRTKAGHGRTSRLPPIQVEDSKKLRHRPDFGLQTTQRHIESDEQAMRKILDVV